MNEAAVNFSDREWDDSRTYKSDARMMAGLLIFQLLMWLVQCFYLPCILFSTPSHDRHEAKMKKEQEKLEKEKKKQEESMA